VTAVLNALKYPIKTIEVNKCACEFLYENYRINPIDVFYCDKYKKELVFMTSQAEKWCKTYLTNGRYCIGEEVFVQGGK